MGRVANTIGANLPRLACIWPINVVVDRPGFDDPQGFAELSQKLLQL